MNKLGVILLATLTVGLCLALPMPDLSESTLQPHNSPRPKGCSPGCGPTEICVELGASYCRSNTCSVCIKMAGIRLQFESTDMQVHDTRPCTDPLIY